MSWLVQCVEGCPGNGMRFSDRGAAEQYRYRHEVQHWVEESCRAQGVPVKVTDPRVLRQVAVLLGVKRS